MVAASSEMANFYSRWIDRDGRPTKGGRLHLLVAVIVEHKNRAVAFYCTTRPVRYSILRACTERLRGNAMLTMRRGAPAPW